MKKAALLDDLATEGVNPAAAAIDTASDREILEILHAEDRKAVDAVGEELPSIARALAAIFERYRRGGRLFYIGAGTSGRLGALDAAELPPTFGISPDRAIAVLAGGRDAMFRAIEGAEDDESAAGQELQRHACGPSDSVIGVTASGRTPFVLGGVRSARSSGALTVGIASNPGSPLTELVDVSICIQTGPEAIQGSTRLKSGSAQKMALNMLSTALMVRMGYVFGNKMVNLQPTNTKLHARAVRLVRDIAQCDEAAAARALETTHDVRAAVILLQGLSAEEAQRRLEKAGGSLARALEGRD